MSETREERIAWMALWAANNQCQLVLDGEIGFGRECVGITKRGSYPDWAGDDWEGPAGMPYIEHAYHKHPCVAVLGTGEDRERELFVWLKWFDENGYTVEAKSVPLPPGDPMISLLLGKGHRVAMVKK